MTDSTEQDTLSAAEAAALLNLSRTQLLSLLEAGTIKSLRVDRHFRVNARDLYRYRDKHRDARAALLDKLAAADAEYLR